jgi:hypothetical protein
MADITSGLVSYWKMDDGSGTIVTDFSGNGHNGTFVGSPTWVAGKYGGGLQGNNNGFNATFNFTPTNFTVAFWIYPQTLVSYNNQIGANGGSWGGFVILNSSTGAIMVGTDSGSRIGPTSDGIYVVNQWIHIVFTYNAGVGILYKNGVVVATKSGMTAPTVWTQFGATLTNSSGLKAILDEVCIYSRALSQDDVTSLYSNVIPTPTFASLSFFNSITYNTVQVNSIANSPNTIAYGICYSSTNPLPTLADSYTVDGTLENTHTSFVSQLTGLNTSTKYYVRAYATESGGTTYYSAVQTFQTLQFGIILNSLAISIDKGTIPPMNKVPFSLMNLAISIDKGIIPPKNYFKSQINTLAISLDKADESILTYQIL